MLPGYLIIGLKPSTLGLVNGINMDGLVMAGDSFQGTTDRTGRVLSARNRKQRKKKIENNVNATVCLTFKRILWRNIKSMSY